jgi:dienelactone hydrolase
MPCPDSRGGYRTGWALALTLLVALAPAATAIAAAPFALANMRFEPDPAEAYARVILHVDYAGATAPIIRLWVQLTRTGTPATPVPYTLRSGGFAAPAGTLSRSLELGEPGPRHLSLVAEDERGARSAPLEADAIVREPARHYDECTYRSDGLKIKGYLYLPPGPGPFPAIIYSHGSVLRGELAQPRRFEWLAYRLARLGYATFVAERRGYGGSEGNGVIGNEGLNSLRYGAPGEVRDVLAAIDFLKRRPEIDGTRIALLGKSLGGFVSLLAAAEQPELRAVVSLAGGYGSGDRMMSPAMLFIQSELQAAARRIQVPTLVMHAENDRVVPVSLSRMVVDELQRRDIPAIGKIYPPFTVAGKEMEGHALFDGVNGLSYYWADLTAFLARALTP